MDKGKIQDMIRERVLKVADYIIDTAATYRETAKVFHVCKSTVARDMTLRLPSINHAKYEEVRIWAELNKEEAVIRGGQTTKRRYFSNGVS